MQIQNIEKLIKEFQDKIGKEEVYVSAFIPIQGEIHCDFILHSLFKLNPNIKGCLPIVQGKDKPLIFREYKEGDLLVEAEFKTLIPDSSKPLINPDILLVPLLAFTEEKFRLGYGGGFYDRTIEGLEKEKDLLTIGVAFDVQKVDEMPIHEFDKSLKYVVTETKLYQ